jgi:hypothetical protein
VPSLSRAISAALLSIGTGPTLRPGEATLLAHHKYDTRVHASLLGPGVTAVAAECASIAAARVNGDWAVVVFSGISAQVE